MTKTFRSSAIRFLKKFKSPWYYWHTGHKKIALLSMLLSAGILWICLGATVGFSMIGIILAILLDGIGLGLALLYLIFLRAYIPEWTSLQSNADAFVMNILIWPLLAGFFVSRISSFVVAKVGGYTDHNQMDAGLLS
ncbi:MAG TPA: hypothetical protein P5102_14845 [Candidatus Competibacteraceae bacterium]|nr:hypothetical protein [Candidatus Competibacteraceae bacterium]